MTVAEAKKTKFDLHFCSVCGQSFESEYKLNKRLNLSHPETISGGCCSSHEHEDH